jgi:ankyrin repeat protein
MTPLMEAIAGGSATRELIEGRADVNVVVQGHTPLSLAVQRCEPDIIDKLVEAGANVNFEITEGEYALTMAVKGQEGVISIPTITSLLRGGASLSILHLMRNTLLYRTIFESDNMQPELFDVLLAFGAQLSDFEQSMLNYKASYNSAPERVRTASSLLKRAREDRENIVTQVLACEHMDPAMMKIVLEYTILPNIAADIRKRNVSRYLSCFFFLSFFSNRVSF